MTLAASVGGAGVRMHGGELRLRGTVIASNHGSRDLSRSASVPDVLTSLGHNVIGAWYAGDDEPFLDSDAIDVTNAGLAPLTDNGGPTETVALLDDSPARDFIPASGCLDANDNPVDTDQRGESRPNGSHCDAGAFEAR